MATGPIEQAVEATRAGRAPDGGTRVAGVIGDPIRHSRSPAIHNAAYRRLGLDWVYVALPVLPGAAEVAIRGAHALGLAGLSVTMPFKELAAELADERSAEVERLGAANTLVFTPEQVSAHSTDGAGFLADLREGLGVEPAGQVCAVLGAGGAARSVVLALAAAGASGVIVVNRDAGRARRAAALAGAAGSVGDAGEIAAASLVVNATPLGMAGRDGELLDAAIAALHPGQSLYDLVYEPAETPLLRAAAARGLAARGGLGMLVHQAVVQFELMTGVPAPIEVMWEAASQG